MIPRILQVPNALPLAYFLSDSVSKERLSERPGTEANS